MYPQIFLRVVFPLLRCPYRNSSRTLFQMTIRILFLAILCVVLSVTARCPAGLIQGSMPDECFAYGSNSNWFDAQTHCVSLGGHLAFVRSAFTNAILINMANTCGVDGDTAMWLGASIGVFSTTWTWLDGSSITYSNWARGKARYIPL